MQIHWKDGSHDEVQFGRKLVGIKKAGSRPIKIDYTQEEYNALSMPDESKQKYIAHLRMAVR